MQGALVPAVIALLVHVDNVTNAQLELVLAIGRVGRDATESVITNVTSKIRQLETWKCYLFY